MLSKQLSAALALSAAAIFATPASAATQVAVRAFGTVGGYSIDGSAVLPDDSVLSVDQSETTLGLGVGLAWGIDSFFSDISLELLDIATFRRTDALLSAGYRFNKHWSAFGGLRYTLQSVNSPVFGSQNEQADFFDDNFYSEIGPFVGIGFGNIKLGKKPVLSLSAAYAYNDLSPAKESFGDADGDSAGVSVKASLGFRGSPHSFALRYQRFDGEFEFSNDSKLDYTEDYILVTYQFSVWRGRF